MTNHVFYSNCVWCGAPHTCASNATPGEDGQPSDGDVTLCLACGEWLVFERSYVRAPTPEEFVEIGSDPDCRAARKVWVQVAGHNRRPDVQFTDSVN